MGKNKLPIQDFNKLMDEFGWEAANETLNDVNEGKIRPETLQKYLYDDDVESRDEYLARLRREAASLEDDD